MQTDGFFGLLFSSFFRWWWALITGLISIVSYLAVPGDIHLNKFYSAILTFCVLTLVFLVISTVYQGWLLYKNRLTAPKVVGFLNSNIYSGKFVFLIESTIPIEQGKIAELQRFDNGIESCFALIEFKECNSKGQFQAHPIWIAPGHLRDLQMNKFVMSDINVNLIVDLNTLYSAKDNLN